MLTKKYFVGHWTRIDLSHYTSDKTINAVWKESVPNKMSEFLRFTVDTDEVLAIVTGELLKCKIYETGGDEIARGSRGLITAISKRQTLAKEIIPFEYPYDISWVDQHSKRLEDNLRIVLRSDTAFVFFSPGDSLIFNINSTSTIPATPHANTLFSYHAYLFAGSYSRFIELKSKNILSIPGADILAQEVRRMRKPGERTIKRASSEDLSKISGMKW